MTRQTDQNHFVGTWVQELEAPEPACISIVFESGGAVYWSMTGLSDEAVALEWRLEGNRLFISQPGSDELVSTFSFEGPDVMVLQFEGIRHVYQRRRPA